MSFAFYRTTKYRKRYIFRYRRRYHFVAIRDCWSAIIVDSLFGGQLVHSYIQDINTSLTYHFWLSGYPASSLLCFFGGFTSLSGITIVFLTGGDDAHFHPEQL